MNKEIVPAGNYISMIILFVFGSSLIMGVTGKSGGSSWIALLLALGLVVPFLMIYARLSVLFPGKDLFDILVAVFGKIGGKILSCLYIWYALHLGSLVLRNFGEFCRTVALTETPMIVPMLFVGLLGISAVKAGIEVMGRTARLLLVFSIFVIIIVQILALPLFNFDFLRPVLDPGWVPILNDTFGAFTFPFAETVLFLGTFRALPEKGSGYKILLSGLLIAGALITFISVRNLLVLGPNALTSLYFPSYVAVSRINVGDFLTRIEGSSAIVFCTSLFIKVSICLYVASTGMSKVFNLKSYRSVVLQMGLIMVYMSDFIFKDIFEMQHFAFETYRYYALPFQVIIPLILWIGAELVIRKKGNRKQKSS
ncbi:GerAB/ArcD/ProY family transporter [Paenibacillus wynnii]|uniref:GerAB/ArcD/ProY family transporter n=1 Tax=Paenibacillus wynnii TaxID=268407 RepID=UPI002793A9DE|nr:endospore germination permease [Paenibacillus wynnii]MDQ0195186.1 spore germination protein KB [Paenibacillus wynnii]